MRSNARILADEVSAGGGKFVLPEVPGVVTGGAVVPQVQFRGGNLQVNSPSLDNIQVFTGVRPFVHTTQSETSLAARGQNVVATYNTSAGIHYVPNPSGPGLLADQVFLSGYSHSPDGGKTWTSGFMPPMKGSIFTFGDPSVGVDRKGNFYFAALGADAAGKSTIQVNKSTDGGASWGAAVLVQQDDGGDKEWLTVGPDPIVKSRDNVYVTWTSFQSACELRFGKSVDGGQTWLTKTIFVPTPDPDPTKPQDCLQFSNPVVDSFTGRLYVPFLRFSNADVDFIQMLVSDDAGETFQFVKFNYPNAPVPDAIPVLQAGELIECGATRVSTTPPRYSVNLRLTIHAGPNVGGSVTGLARYVNATRLVTQPSIAVRNGVVYLAWSGASGQYYGDPSNKADIWFIRSTDAGNNWGSSVRVNPAVSDNVQHVLPSLAIDNDPNDVHVMYYTQHADGSVDVDTANSHDRGKTFPANRTVRMTSTAFALPPTNVPLPTATQPFATTNYDRNIAQCYGLGEYLSVYSTNGTVYGLWGDARNTIVEPVSSLSPLSGQTHSQQDVFFQAVKAQ